MERAWRSETHIVAESTAVMLLNPALWRGRISKASAAAGVSGALYGLQQAIGNHAVGQMIEAARGSAPEATRAPRTEETGGGPHAEAPCSCGGSCDRCRGSHPTRVASQGVLQGAGPGRPLEPFVKTDMEERFNADFSGVRIHTDAPARQSAAALEAAAFTVGRKIFFGAGKYDPHSCQGRRLLAHELTHVRQQERSPEPAAGVALGEPGDRYEREARRVADQVTRPGAPAGRKEPGADSRGGAASVEIREQWHGPVALLSRAPADATVVAAPSPLQAAGITPTQALGIKLWYDRTMAMAKSDAWKRCYLACKLVADCGLAPLQSPIRMPMKLALDALLGPHHWDSLLTDSQGVRCHATTGRTCESCCDDVAATAPVLLNRPRGGAGPAPHS